MGNEIVMKLNIQSSIVIAIFVLLANVEGRAKRDYPTWNNTNIGETGNYTDIGQYAESFRTAGIGLVENGGVYCNTNRVEKKTCKECGTDDWSCDSENCFLKTGWIWNECVRRDTLQSVPADDPRISNYVDCNHTELKAKTCKDCGATKSTCHSYECRLDEGWIYDECVAKDHFDR